MKASILYFFLLSSLFCFSQAFEIESFATGLDRPVNIKNAGDNRLFVVEQEGTISIVNSDGSVESTPFLDITDRVVDIGPIGDERGLLGLAFHPNYSSNGFFYVNYINTSGNTVVSRFSRSTASTANPNSELNILTMIQPFENHNGGDMAFGADGYLYISSGDGGSGGDPDNRGQQLNTLLGKILRIDVDNAANGNNYAIPTNNPFTANSNAEDEIWAYGLRNPWKFSFDRSNGDIWIADVGQENIEEINRMSITVGDTGINYGWRCFEGNDSFNSDGCADSSTMEFPVSQYEHIGMGEFKCSITGGYCYRGTDYPNLTGLYFFADFCSEEIGYLEQNGNSWDMTLIDQTGTNGWSTFGEDINGELYIAGIISGTIHRIVGDPLSVSEIDSLDIKIYPNPSSSFINFEFETESIDVINIYDSQGKRVQQKNVVGLSAYKLSTNQFLDGLYIAEIKASTGKTSRIKLILN